MKKESATDIFAKIAREKGLLDDAKLAQAREAQKAARKEKRALSLENACIELGILTADQVRGIQRGIRYYVVRKADRIYGKVAIEKGFVDDDVVRNCLSKQHDEFFKNKKLIRLSKLLMGLDAITTEEDDEVRKVVIGRLTPAESAHEAQAIRDEEALPAAGSEDEEAIAEEVAASADEEADAAEKKASEDLSFSDDDLESGDEEEGAPGKGGPMAGSASDAGSRDGEEAAAVKQKPRVPLRKAGHVKLPAKPLGLAKQKKPLAREGLLKRKKD
jgi:hypothetical protein